MKELKALIDTDSLIYKAASVAQEVIEWSEDSVTILVDKDVAIEAFDKYIENILSDTKCKEFLLVISQKRTFRYDVLESYKGNRKPPKYPLELLGVVRKYVINNYDVHLPEDIEADDYCVAKMYEEPKDWILCHIDKDLNQAIVLHYNYNTKEKYLIEQEEADYVFYKQVLTGDSVDGYRGCPSVGPKKADKILEGIDLNNEEETWDAIVETYESKGLDEDCALQQARVARMLRGREISADGMRLENLWSPQHKIIGG